MTNYNGFDREDLIKEIERLREQKDSLFLVCETLVEGLKKIGGFDLVIYPIEMCMKRVKESP